MSLLDNFPDTAIAKRRKRSKDSLGGSKDAWETVFTGRTCWRQPLGNQEIKEAQQREIKVSHKVYFTADPELDEHHILIIDGDTMTVRSASHPDASAGLGVVWKVLVDLED
jgi:hypothetical protein